MYRTLELKLLLDDDQRMALLRTMEEYTRAFDLSARWGYANRTSNKYVHQRETYHMLRKEGFMSWIVQSAKDTACEALKQCKLRSVPKRREHSSIRYPWRVAKVYFDSGMVSISSVDGRLHVRTIVPQYFREKYGDWTAKMSILRYDKVTRTFYLGVVVEKKAAPPQMKGDVLGIDRGLKNIAVCSNNVFFNSSRVNNVRGRFAKNRRELQAKGTRSAKRRLRKMSGRERRFVTCENHVISKQIANMNYAVFALEDLKGIRTKRCVDVSLRSKLGRWSYYQLEQDIKYKAEELGKTVLLVDPTCTSQWCSKCGWIDRISRKGSEFHCVKCGLQLHADLNASRTIAHLGISEVSRLLANQPNVTGDEEGVSGAHGIVPSPVTSEDYTEQLVLVGSHETDDHRIKNNIKKDDWKVNMPDRMKGA